MPSNYLFKDSKMSDSVAKALLFAAKFSRKQALVKFGDSSVSVIWGGSPKTYYIHTQIAAMDMFRNRQQLRQFGIDQHCTIIQVNPMTLGKTLKVGTSNKNVSISVMKPNKIRVMVESGESGKKFIVHNLPCEFKTMEDYRTMLIEEIERSVCRFDTRSFVDNIHRFRHIVDSLVRLNTPRIYIWSTRSGSVNEISIQTKTQGSNVYVNLSDLENGFAQRNNDSESQDEDNNNPRRSEAGVNVDTKKLAFFLAGLTAQRRSKVCFEIEHNKCLKISLDHEIPPGEKSYQSLLLLHSLNN